MPSVKVRRLQFPNCPNCGDSVNVEGPDGDGDYKCSFSSCDVYFNQFGRVTLNKVYWNSYGDYIGTACLCAVPYPDLGYRRFSVAHPLHLSRALELGAMATIVSPLLVATFPVGKKMAANVGSGRRQLCSETLARCYFVTVQTGHLAPPRRPKRSGWQNYTKHG